MALPTANQTQYKQFLRMMMETREPILAVGDPGIGKTYTPIKFCKDNGIDLILSHPAVDMPQDYKGLAAKSKAWIPDRDANDEDAELLALLSDQDQPFQPNMKEIDTATFLPFDIILQVLQATKPTIWFFDDFGQGTPSVQSAQMQLFGSRELCGKKVPDCVAMMAATNSPKHRANVYPLLEPMKSRFGMIFELQADFRSWRDEFCPQNGILPSIPLFLEYKPEAFNSFNPKSGMENSPNPRLWHKLSTQLKTATSMGFDNATRSIVCAGCVGSTWGLQYSAFENMQSNLPPMSDILDDPESYPINQPLDVRYAVLGMLATQGKDHQAADIFTYTGKMAKEYQMVFYNLVQRYNEELADSDPCVRWSAANMHLMI